MYNIVVFLNAKEVTNFQKNFPGDNKKIPSAYINFCINYYPLYTLQFKISAQIPSAASAKS